MYLDVEGLMHVNAKCKCTRTSAMIACYVAMLLGIRCVQGPQEFVMLTGCAVLRRKVIAALSFIMFGYF